jgi:hypothetical protein
MDQLLVVLSGGGNMHVKGSKRFRHGFQRYIQTTKVIEDLNINGSTLDGNFAADLVFS